MSAWGNSWGGAWGASWGVVGPPPVVVVAGALGAPRDELGARPVLASTRRPAGQAHGRPTHTAAARPALTGGRRR